MKSTIARRSSSLGVLLLGLFVSWFLPATIEVSEPPGTLPWYVYGELWAVIVTVPLLLCVAAKRWFRASVFFSFGCLDALSLAICFFFPSSSRPSDEEIYRGVWIALAFCILAGCLAAALGHRVACMLPSPQTRQGNARTASPEREI